MLFKLDAAQAQATPLLRRTADVAPGNDAVAIAHRSAAATAAAVNAADAAEAANRVRAKSYPAEGQALSSASADDSESDCDDGAGASKRKVAPPAANAAGLRRFNSMHGSSRARGGAPPTPPGSPHAPSKPAAGFMDSVIGFIADTAAAAAAASPALPASSPMPTPMRARRPSLGNSPALNSRRLSRPEDLRQRLEALKKLLEDGLLLQHHYDEAVSRALAADSLSA
jgi:hypothetical protein